ncbi:MAG: YafY family transcriptional regulator [Desulfobulbaceae bacterium]|nr:YafY family transcriptional regulator [Desulfobulbaceae bacterium]
MNKFDRIYELLALFRSKRHPVSINLIMEQLECSSSTVKRLIGKLRHEMGAPINYDPAKNGYFLDSNNQWEHEIPGLWFTLAELQALLMIQELLSNLEPGLLKADLKKFRRKIEQVLEAHKIPAKDPGSRLLLLGFGKRPYNPQYFNLISTATLQRQQLRLHYHGRQNNTISKRTISPQRLIYYRDNWYLTCWCHLKNDFRTLALEKISKVQVLNKEAEEFAPPKLNYLQSTFGIFSGPPTNTAVLRFTPERARWVADEQWHPDQQGKHLDDGSYELLVPYSDSRELLLDILKYGPDVTVLGPETLRIETRNRLMAALNNYQ